MWLSDLAIKRPVFITMILLALVVIGMTAYSRMGVDLLPDISFPYVTIQTAYPGAGPEEVESQVSKPMEEAVGSLSGVKSVRSTSTEGMSVVLIQFQLEHPVARAVADVQERVLAVKSGLPQDVRDPVILRFDPATLPVLTVAVADKSGPLTPDRLRKEVDDKIKPRIERLSGVAAVEINGGLEREIHVELSAERLTALKLSPQQVVAAITAENLNVPAGHVEYGDRELTLRTPGNFQRVEDIGQVVVSRSGGVPIRVRDVATVSDGFKDVDSYTRLNGRDSVGISVRKQSGVNTVEVANGVHDELNRLLREYPNLEIIVAFDQSDFIKTSIKDTQVDLVIGAILAAIVVLLFFRSIGNTLVTVAGLPVILIGTFWAMSLFGFTINMITLMALALCIGLLIDDAIVVRENIFRHMEEGEKPRVAASRGTGEVALAVVSMTMCVVSVFLPVAFATGIVGRLLRDFGITVAAAVLISLFEAFTLAPVLIAYFLHGAGKRSAGTKNLNVGRGGKWNSLMLYERFLSWGLSHRRLVIGLAVAVFVASLATVPLVGQSFMEQFDQPEFQMALELPAGASLDMTSRTVLKVEEGLLQQPEVKHVFTIIGSSSGPEYATFFVRLDDKRSVEKVQQYLRQQSSSLGKLAFSSETFGGGSSSSVFGRPIQLELTTTGSFEELDAVSQKVQAAMSEVAGLEDIDRSLKPGKPELRVEIDRERAADLRLSVAQVGSTLRALVSGQRASQLRAGGEEIDILVRLRKEDRQNLQDILSLALLNQKDVLVPLNAVARLSPASGPTQVDRRDRQRIIAIGANFKNRPQGDIVRDIQTRLNRLNLPPEISYKFAGQTEMMSESFNVLYFSIALSVIFMYMVLASLYGSFVQPLIIMLALPLSVIGAFLALLITRKSLDMTAMIGMILLMGIVAKNSIIMVDFINMKRREGMELREAILTAAPMRLRPILMTTLALIFGMLAIAVGLGAGGEFRATMAIAVIGGLVTSTFLSLIVVPVAYSIVEGRKKRPGKVTVV